jgi:transposase
MLTVKILKKLLRVDNVAIDDVRLEAEKLIVRIHPYKKAQHRCPICGKVRPLYDNSRKLKKWRSLDLGTTKVYLESYVPRIKCPDHKVRVAAVPWAELDSDYTKDFEMAVTWSALHMTASDVSEFYRIKWHTVGHIAGRVQQKLDISKPNRFDNLQRIGVDETSYKKGHKYMTVIVNHDTGALIWAKKDHGKKVLDSFFAELTEEQRASIKLVSGDGARWITDCVKEFCPNAHRCVDPFHVVGWATDALDEVRKDILKETKQKVAKGEQALPVKKNKI